MQRLAFTEDDPLIIRKALLEQIHNKPNAKLIVLRAPAGYGKTTAGLQFRFELEAKGVSTTWFSFEGGDERSADILSNLKAALTPQRLIAAATDSDADKVSKKLRNVVFLDSFERIQDGPISDCIASALDSSESCAQIILISRSRPKIKLARLRIHGLVHEIGANDLRFTLPETRELCANAGGLNWTANDIYRLHRDTGGWPLAVNLLARNFDREGHCGEKNRFESDLLSDYLMEEVFACQPENVQRFLRTTSVLRYLDVRSCEALSADSEAPHVLRYLLQEDIFLSPVSGRDGTYQFHKIFAEFLSGLRTCHQFDAEQALHAKAANWLEMNGQPEEAIHHALAAGQTTKALEQLEQSARVLLEQGRMKQLARWFDQIPKDDLDAFPQLRLISIWAVLFTAGPLTAQAMLERSAFLTSTEPGIAANVNALSVMIAAMQDDYHEARRLAEQALPQLPSPDPFADSILCNVLANSIALTGDAIDAVTLLDTARRLQGDCHFNAMYAESLDGILDLQRALLRSAAAKFRVAVNNICAPLQSFTRGNAWAGMLLAYTEYETDNIAKAESLVDCYLPATCEVALRDHIIIGHLIKSRIAFSRGDISQAFEALSALESQGYVNRFPRLVVASLLERSFIHLLMGDRAMSKELLDRLADDPIWKRTATVRLLGHETNDFLIAKLRWDIHFGSVDDALERLEFEIAAADQSSRHMRAIKLRLLHAMALQKTGASAIATSALAKVLRRTGREGFIRILVEEGEFLGRMIAQFYATLEAAPSQSGNPNLSDYVHRLLGAFGPLPANGIEPETPLMETLTPKEIQVLQMVVDGKSNSDISSVLGVSDSTVRTHLRNINQKFSCKSRAEAAAIGRRLGIVD